MAYDLPPELKALMDLMRSGIVLLDAGGRALWLNRTARDIVEADDGLLLHGERIVASGPTDNAGLPGEVEGLAGCLASGSARICTATRKSFRRPYTLALVGLGSASRHRTDGIPVAALLICDPELPSSPSSSVLEQLFGLTRREAEVARVLTEGCGVVEAAERLGISEATVRTHLKQILAKTGTHRQGEVVSVLVAALPDVVLHRTNPSCGETGRH